MLPVFLFIYNYLKFLQARNLIVKESMLDFKSKAFMGMFRNRKLKLAMIKDISPFADSREVLKWSQEKMYGVMIDKEHSAIGEELGIGKVWIVKDIDDDEIVYICHKTMEHMDKLLSEAYALYDIKFKPVPLITFSEKRDKRVPLEPFQILLESDIDPSLPKKWGW